MKGILEYDLLDPEQEDDFKLAINARDYQLFIWEFSQGILRNYSKYGIPEHIKDAESLLEKIREEFYNFKEKYKIEDPD